jgi:hypothetical protein
MSASVNAFLNQHSMLHNTAQVRYTPDGRITTKQKAGQETNCAERRDVG